MVRPELEKLSRLRQMDGREIAYRLRDMLCRGAERVRFYTLRRPFSIARYPKASHQQIQMRRYLKDAPAHRFYLPATREGRDRLRQFLETRFPEWKKRALREAERLCAHELDLLGYGQINLGGEIDWHRDPVTGRRWPIRFWADYDLVRESAAGDPKTIHELNRQQHLPRLAKVYFLTGEERYAREALEQMLSWIDQNPPGAGINWHSSLEIALRVISWLWTIFFILPSVCFTEQSARRVAESLTAQLEHIRLHPSLYSSPNTHLLGEAAALYMGGVLFNEWPAAPQWKATGHTLLTNELERQFCKYGIHRELSSSYHCYSLDFYLQALVLSMHSQESWPDPAWRRLEQMMDYVMHLTRPGGTLPCLADDDGGRALALSRTHYRSFTDGLSTGAVLYGRADFKFVAGVFCEETLWLLGEQAWHVYSGLKEHAPIALQASYPEAGYFIQRSGWSEQARHIVFDCGGIGMLRGGHGHADALSLTLSAGDEEILVDPGTGIYNTAPEWRNYFRSSRAHNTVLIDGVEHSQPGGTFSWKHAESPQIRRQIGRAEFDYIEGERGRCSSSAQTVVHRRAVLYCRPDYWLIVDRFLGEGRHRFDWFYHFPPGADVALERSSQKVPHQSVLVRTERASLRLLFFSPVPVEAEIVRGRTQPPLGWHSARYGNRIASPTLQLSAESAVPLVVFSALLPAAGAAADLNEMRCRSLETDGCASAAGTLDTGEYQDLWVAGTNEQCSFTVLDFQMRGELFWLRQHKSGERQLFVLNGLSFAESGRPLFETTGSPVSLLMRWGARGDSVEPFEKGNEPSCAEFVA